MEPMLQKETGEAFYHFKKCFNGSTCNKDTAPELQIKSQDHTSLNRSQCDKKD
jgi:hypothetical protein